MSRSKVFFGFASKGGTAAAMAEELYAVAADVADDSYDMELPDELNNLADTVLNSTVPTLLVIVAASTGQGELPVNGAEFLSKLSGTVIENVDFCILCLGDSNYTTFMDGPHDLVRNLLRSKCRLIHQIVEADDGDNDQFANATDSFIDGLPAVIESWIKGQCTEVIPLYHPQSSTSQKIMQQSAYSEIIEFIQGSDHLSSSKISVPKMPNPMFEVVKGEESLTPTRSRFEDIQNGIRFEPLNSLPYECEVLSGKRLTNTKAEKQAWEMTLSLPEVTRIKDNSRQLHCGDCVALFTPNDPEEVKLALNAFGGENIYINACGGRKQKWFPEKGSLEDILKYTVELRTPVTKGLIGHLKAQATDPGIKRRLSEFVSREGKELFRELLVKHVTFIDVVTAFPTLRLKLSALTYLRRLQRRWYSLANFVDYSNEADSRVLRIAFTEVSLPKPGLMTNQLARIIDNLKEPEVVTKFGPCRSRIILECRDPPPNQFRLVEDPAVPVLMIAAGSGIAPFIGFLERCATIPEKMTSLIFGCRNESSYLYKEKLKEFVENGTLNQLHVAMSREGNKKYVQDLVLDMKDEVKILLDNGGLIYICGDGGGMGMGLRNSFIEIVGKEAYWKMMEDRRIREDLWR